MVLLVILVIVKQVTSPKLETKLPRGLKSPALAIEFAEL